MNTATIHPPLTLTEAQRIAESILGAIEWNGAEGNTACPGAAKHTTGTTPLDLHVVVEPLPSGVKHVGVKLLSAIREIFYAKEVSQLSVRDMIQALIERETDEPWAVWWEEGMSKGNVRGVGSKLAKLLKPFGIVSGTIREDDDSTAKGYKRQSFEAAFNVYCLKTA